MRLSHLPHVDRVAIQTNLSGRLDWLAGGGPDARRAVGHLPPGQVSRSNGSWPGARGLDRLGVRFSVGVVGLPEHLG